MQEAALQEEKGSGSPKCWAIYLKHEMEGLQKLGDPQRDPPHPRDTQTHDDNTHTWHEELPAKDGKAAIRLFKG